MVESLFVGAVAALGGKAGNQAGSAYARLAERYRGRPYHNLRHIEAVLETFLTIAEDLSSETESQITLALCYHDAIYDPRAKDNESQSAALANRELEGLGISAEDRAEIGRLILLTQDHRAAGDDHAGAIVVDSDLAILQTPPADYEAYAAAIREEYAWVSDDDYRAGRTQVLKKLLDRPLFTSHILDEEVARANLRREIETLAG